MKFCNYKSELVTAPRDFNTTIATHCATDDGPIVCWSVSARGEHRVRYGLQVDNTYDDLEAAHKFGEAVHHFAECEGLILTND